MLTLTKVLMSWLPREHYKEALEEAIGAITARTPNAPPQSAQSVTEITREVLHNTISKMYEGDKNSEDCIRAEEDVLNTRPRSMLLSTNPIADLYALSQSYTRTTGLPSFLLLHTKKVINAEGVLARVSAEIRAAPDALTTRNLLEDIARRENSKLELFFVMPNISSNVPAENVDGVNTGARYTMFYGYSLFSIVFSVFSPRDAGWFPVLTPSLAKQLSQLPNVNVSDIADTKPLYVVNADKMRSVAFSDHADQINSALVVTHALEHIADTDPPSFAFKRATPDIYLMRDQCLGSFQLGEAFLKSFREASKKRRPVLPTFTDSFKATFTVYNDNSVYRSYQRRTPLLSFAYGDTVDVFRNATHSIHQCSPTCVCNVAYAFRDQPFYYTTPSQIPSYDPLFPEYPLFLFTEAEDEFIQREGLPGILITDDNIFEAPAHRLNNESLKKDFRSFDSTFEYANSIPTFLPSLFNSNVFLYTALHGGGLQWGTKLLYSYLFKKYDRRTALALISIVKRSDYNVSFLMETSSYWRHSQLISTRVGRSFQLLPVSFFEGVLPSPLVEEDVAVVAYAVRHLGTTRYFEEHYLPHIKGVRERFFDIKKDDRHIDLYDYDGIEKSLFKHHTIINPPINAFDVKVFAPIALVPFIEGKTRGWLENFTNTVYKK